MSTPTTPTAPADRPASISRGAKLLYAALLVAAAWSLASVTGLADASDLLRPAHTRLVIELPRAVGLYPGDAVLVQGIESGQVEQVEPRLDHVLVTVSVRDVGLAEDAKAVVRLRSLIGERFIELGPVWTGEGTPIADGATIPQGRTDVPMELSDVLRETGRVVEGVDPQGLKRLLGELADALEGREDTVGQLVADLGEIGSVLTSRADELDRDLTHLDRVVTTLAERDRQIVDLLEGGAVVSEALMAQDGALDAAIGGLDAILSEVAQLTRTQRTTIVTIMDSFDRVGTMLAGHADDYARIVEELPLFSYGYERAVQNDGERWFVVNNPRGILFLPHGRSANSGPGAPEGRLVPRIYHDDSPLRPLVPSEVDVTEVTGPGPLLPSLRIGPSGVETIDDEEDDDDGGGS